MDKEQKQRFVEDLNERLQKSKDLILIDYRGLKTGEMEKLRKEIRSVPADVLVVKNTLTRLVFKQQFPGGWEKLFSYLIGPTGIAINYGDLVNLAKILVGFSKLHSNLKIKAGLVNNQILTAEKLKILAFLPPREVLLSMLVSQLKAPLTGLAQAIIAPLQKLVFVLKAIETGKSKK